MWGGNNVIIRKTARVFEILSFVIGSHAISAQAEVGDGTRFFHHGCGIVIHHKTVIGKNCKIFQNVTIGQKWSPTDKIDGVPVVGDNVMIGAGAIVIGKIIIGNNVTIGANAVVTKDIPDGQVVVGVSK